MPETHASIDFAIVESSTEPQRMDMSSGDRFFWSLTDAAKACKALDKAKEFSVQFVEMLTVLEDWIAEHKSRLSAAHLHVREHDILFLVVQRELPYDAQLSDALTQLDLKVANDSKLELIELNVMAIPPVPNEDRTAFMADGSLTYAE